jgi:hypothetical protein
MALEAQLCLCGEARHSRCEGAQGHLGVARRRPCVVQSAASMEAMGRAHSRPFRGLYSPKIYICPILTDRRPQHHGLRDLPTATHPARTHGVTLACTRAQETAGYMYERDGVDATEQLTVVCPRIPVHCIFGTENDLVCASFISAYM